MISNQRTSDSERLSLASDILLAPAQLGTDQLQSLLGGKLAGRADYADVYFQHSRHEAWILEDGLVRDASFNLERGAGVRLVSGDKTGFAYSDDIRGGAGASRHQAWVAMMRPRLELARSVMSPRAALFVSIDDHEAAHLRLLLDDGDQAVPHDLHIDTVEIGLHAAVSSRDVLA